MNKWNLFLSTNVLSFEVLTILTLFCVILQYPQSKREILRQKEKQYSVKLHDFFCVFYVGWTYILRGSLFIKVVSQ